MEEVRGAPFYMAGTHEGRPAFEYSFQQAVSDGAFVPFALVDVAMDASPWEDNDEDVMTFRRLVPRSEPLVGVLAALLRGECPLKTIIFVESTADAHFVANKLNDGMLAPAPTASITTAADPLERSRLEQWFLEPNKPRIAVVVGAFDGLGTAEVECVAVLRTVRSPSLYLRMVCTGALPRPGKEAFMLFDPLRNFEFFDGIFGGCRQPDE